MSKFVKMVKDGEEPIEVDPSVVADHKSLGWRVAGEEPAAPEAAKVEGGEKKAEGVKASVAKRRSRKKSGESMEETAGEAEGSEADE